MKRLLLLMFVAGAVAAQVVTKEVATCDGWDVTVLVAKQARVLHFARKPSVTERDAAVARLKIQMAEEATAAIMAAKVAAIDQALQAEMDKRKTAARDLTTGTPEQAVAIVFPKAGAEIPK